MKFELNMRSIFKHSSRLDEIPEFNSIYCLNAEPQVEYLNTNLTEKKFEPSTYSKILLTKLNKIISKLSKPSFTLSIYHNISPDLKLTHVLDPNSPIFFFLFVVIDFH